MQIIVKIFATIGFLFVGLVVIGVMMADDDSSTAGSAGATTGDAAETATSEEQRAERIVALEQEVKAVPASEIQKNLDLYRKLSNLDPENATYTQKVVHYTAKRDEAANMRRNPERFVTVTDFSWTKDGFGSVMEVDLTIKSTLPFRVKDIEVKCTHAANSGTAIDSNRRTIYEVIGAGETRTFRGFNMGFIHPQAVSSVCEVVDVARMG